MWNNVENEVYMCGTNTHTPFDLQRFRFFHIGKYKLLNSTLLTVVFCLKSI